MSDKYIRIQDAVDALEEVEHEPWYLHKDLEWLSGVLEAKDAIKSLKPADVVQVVHGKWTKEDRGYVEYCAVCDQCGFDWMWSDRGYFKFCPNCGAKMDGKGEE